MLGREVATEELFTRGAFSTVITGEAGFGVKRGVFLYAIMAW
jgi:hypothetical protein